MTKLHLNTNNLRFCHLVCHWERRISPKIKKECHPERTKWSRGICSHKPISDVSERNGIDLARFHTARNGAADLAHGVRAVGKYRNWRESPEGRQTLNNLCRTTKQAQGRCCHWSEVPIPHRGRGAQPTCPGLPWRDLLAQTSIESHQSANDWAAVLSFLCSSVTRHFRSMKKFRAPRAILPHPINEGLRRRSTYHERTKPIDSRHHTDRIYAHCLGAVSDYCFQQAEWRPAQRRGWGLFLIGLRLRFR